MIGYWLVTALVLVAALGVVSMFASSGSSADAAAAPADPDTAPADPPAAAADAGAKLTAAPHAGGTR